MISEGSCDTEDWSNGCLQNNYKTPGPTVVDVGMKYYVTRSARMTAPTSHSIMSAINFTLK